MAEWNDIRMTDQWKEMSAIVQNVRHGIEPAGMNPVLDGLVNSGKHEMFAPAYALWAADNSAMSVRFDDAAKRYLRVAEQFADRFFFGEPWPVQALRSAADCFVRLNAIPNAMNCFERLLKRFERHGSPAEIWAQAGSIYENLGKAREAAQFFKRAARASKEDSLAEKMARFHASRRLSRIESRRGWMRPSASALAQELAYALQKRNGKALARLISPTHAQIGFIPSEPGFVNSKVLMRHFREALSSPDLRVDPYAVHGDGDKFYLPVNGLSDDLFQGDLVFLIGRTSYGFEWQGIGLSGIHRDDPSTMKRLRDLSRRDNDDYPGGRDPHDGPPEPPPPPPLPPGPPPPFDSVASLGLKCPYPRDLNLRAGMKQFVVKQAAFAAAAALAGPFYWAALGALVLGESIGSPCGFGPGGFYYGYWPTHVDDEFFAIDFARFAPGVPYVPVLTRGTPVLAAAEGIVRFVRSSISTGTADAAGSGNEVRIAHVRSSDATPAVVAAASSGTPHPALRFTSVYIHMMGPFRVPVSVGQFVQRGARLGLMDSTGTSVYDHLHFSLHDRTVPFTGGSAFFPGLGMSVRPTPMDGQTLLGGDDGRCMQSTNVPIP